MTQGDFGPVANFVIAGQLHSRKQWAGSKFAVCLTLRHIRYAQYSMKVQTHCPQNTKASVALWTEDWTSYPSLKRNISESDLAKNDVKVPRPKIDYILLLGRKNFRFIFLVIRRSETERSTKEKQFECFLPLLDEKKKEGGFNKGMYCLPHVEKKGKNSDVISSKGHGFHLWELLFIFTLPVNTLQQGDENGF